MFLLVKAINKMQNVGQRVMKRNKDGQRVIDVAPTCPFCLEEVKEGATRCPHCAAEFDGPAEKTVKVVEA